MRWTGSSRVRRPGRRTSARTPKCRPVPPAACHRCVWRPVEQTCHRAARPAPSSPSRSAASARRPRARRRRWRAVGRARRPRGSPGVAGVDDEVRPEVAYVDRAAVSLRHRPQCRGRDQVHRPVVEVADLALRLEPHRPTDVRRTGRRAPTWSSARSRDRRGTRPPAGRRRTAPESSSSPSILRNRREDLPLPSLPSGSRSAQARSRPGRARRPARHGSDSPASDLTG